MSTAQLGQDILLDPATGDLLIENGDLVLGASIQQAVNIAIKFVLGEWFLDRSLGFPWFEIVFADRPNRGHIIAAIRRTIESVPGIRAVLTVDVELQANRNALITWTAESVDAPIRGEVTSPVA